MYVHCGHVLCGVTVFTAGMYVCTGTCVCIGHVYVLMCMCTTGCACGHVYRTCGCTADIYTVYVLMCMCVQGVY